LQVRVRQRPLFAASAVDIGWHILDAFPPNSSYDQGQTRSGDCYRDIADQASPDMVLLSPLSAS
jgi:hypothetical protein